MSNNRFVWSAAFALGVSCSAIAGAVSYAQDKVITAAQTLDEDWSVEVGEGATVVCSGVISGSGKVVKSGAGTLILAAENTFTGGVEVNAGTLMAGLNTSAAFGTGAVTVHSTGDKVCRVGGFGGTLANDIAFDGATSATYPGLYVDGKALVKTTFSGAITAVTNLYLATSCDYGECYGDTEIATFTGSIAVTSPGILAGAPHYLINFKCPVTADVIKGYWTASDLTQDGGNHGAFKLSSTSIVTTRAEVDQTRFVCGVANVFSSTSVRSLYFTCEHKKNGVGCVDVNGLAQTFRSAYFEKRAGDDKSYYYMSAYVGPGEEGAEIINTSSTRATVTIGEGDTGNNYSHWYIRMNGYMSWVGNNKQSDFYNRHHDLKGGSISMNSNYFRFYNDMQVSGMSTLSSDGGRRTFDIGETVTCDPFPDATNIAISKSTLRWYSAAALNAVSRRGNMTLSIGSSTQTATSTIQLPSATSILRVKALTVYGETKEPGLYDLSSLHEKVTDSKGMILVIGNRSSTTSSAITWKGAAEGDFAAESNWEGLAEGDSITNYASYYAATINSGSSAQLLNDVYLQALTFGGDLAGFQVTTGESATASLLLTGPLNFSTKSDTATSRTFDLNAPICFNQPSTFAIPQNDTLVLNAGCRLFAATTNTGSGTLTLNGARVDSDLTTEAGTLNVCGRIDGSGTLNASVSNIGLRDAEIYTDVTFPGSSALSLIAGSGPTNVFAGKVTFPVTSALLVPGNAVTLFDGGVASSGKVAFYGTDKGSGTIVRVRNMTSGTRTDGYLHANYDAHLILDTSGVTVACVWVNKDEGMLDFVRDDFFASTWIAGDRNRGVLRFTAGKVDVNKTHQFGSRLTGKAAITGEAPAVIEIVRGAIDDDLPNDMTDAVASHSGAISGSVSVVMNGSGVQTLTGTSTSTGALIVKQGTLVLSSTASWRQASAVRVLGGTLRVDGTKPFNRETTVLDVADSGVITTSGRLYFASAHVNGETIAPGRYTANHPGALAGHITGTGTLIVGKPGSMVIFR